MKRMIPTFLGLVIMIVLLTNCSKEPRYKEYLLEVTTIASDLEEFLSEFQKCYGRPHEYDALLKYHVYSEYTFHKKPDYNMEHFFTNVIPELTKKLSSFIRRYENKVPENRFVSFRELHDLQNAMLNIVGEKYEFESKGGLSSSFCSNMGKVFYLTDVLLKYRKEWLDEMKQ